MADTKATKVEVIVDKEIEEFKEKKGFFANIIRTVKGGVASGFNWVKDHKAEIAVGAACFAAGTVATAGAILLGGSAGGDDTRRFDIEGDEPVELQGFDDLSDDEIADQLDKVSEELRNGSEDKDE